MTTEVSKYKLLKGKHFDVDGMMKRAGTANDIVSLTPLQAEAFSDKVQSLESIAQAESLSLEDNVRAALTLLSSPKGKAVVEQLKAAKVDAEKVAKNTKKDSA